MSGKDFLKTAGPITDPGDLGYLFDNLPTDIGDLCRVVQGLVIHIFWADRYGVQLSPERQAEVQLRFVRPQLARILALDPRPLTEARPPEQRLVGNCRDFSTLLTAMLRRQGVPARARCGFGAYFMPGHFEDHWVCEYWKAEQRRWVLVDAQLDALQQKVLRLPFDPLDVPRDQFIVGGKAWQMCRDGEADPAATQGQPIAATLGGVARVYLGSWPAGNYVRVVNEQAGWSTAYAHLDSVAVADGQAVATGTTLGSVGSTGMATGPHLHYEIWHHEINVDPTGLIGCR